MTELTTDADADLHCPLCEYSLRGLADPRCPECGFAFTWAELRAADRNRHSWLFEHVRHRDLWSLWTTWRRNRRPWRFWRDVTPSNPVRIGRLAQYWLNVGTVIVALLLLPLPHGLSPAARTYLGQVPPYVMPWRPPPPPVIDWFAGLSLRTLEAVRTDATSPNVIGPPLLVLSWPWMTMAALMLFQWSLRRAKITPGHVVRVAVYGCDFGLVTVLAVVAFLPVDSRASWLSGSDGAPLAYFAMFCGVLATVRLTIAYARYLRFPRPLATVLASQLVVVVFVLTALTLTTDLGGLFR